jgi:hypothetical protein
MPKGITMRVNKDRTGKRPHSHARPIIVKKSPEFGLESRMTNDKIKTTHIVPAPCEVKAAIERLKSTFKTHFENGDVDGGIKALSRAGLSIEEITEIVRQDIKVSQEDIIKVLRGKT